MAVITFRTMTFVSYNLTSAFPNAADLTPPGSSPLPLRLVSSGNQTALDAAARAGLVAAGRLEVQWGGVWGGVCSTTALATFDWWRDTHAQVVCRQLGYPDGHAYRVRTVNALLPGPPPADQPQFITYLQCNGSEPGLGACLGSAPNGTGRGTLPAACPPEAVVQVACYSQKRECPHRPSHWLLRTCCGGCADRGPSGPCLLLSSPRPLP